ncbi:MAG: hypothetical protein V4627_17785 [Pseudomonadota bacterium]
MTFTTTNRFNTTAFAIAAAAFAVLHGSMLMGFDHVANNAQKSIDASTQLAKTQITPRAVTLETVVISSRRA